MPPSTLPCRLTRATALAAPRYARTFTSHIHPSPPPTATYTSPERNILQTALTHVPTHGFTMQSLLLSARTHGWPDISIRAMFPRGAAEIAQYHLISQREALASRVD